MLMLSPRRYGSAVLPPTPTGDVWLVTDGIGFNSFIADYYGTSWTAQPNDSPGGIRGIGYRTPNKLYVDTPPIVADISDLGSWTAVPGWSASNLRGYADDGTHVYVARGFNILGRIPYETGTMTTPNLTSDSYAETLCVFSDELYIFSTIDNRCLKSSDSGVNYTTMTEYRPTTESGVGPKAASSNDGIAVGYVDTGGTEIRLRFSSDGANSWSSPETPMPSDAELVALVRTATHFIAFSASGYTAYTASGTSWIAGANIPGGVASVGVSPYGKVVVVSSAGDMYETVDNAQSFQSFNGPTASDNSSVYWIGTMTP